MEIYGYKKQETRNGLLEMKEITISANPNELYKIAEFISNCAKNIEIHGRDWTHEHYPKQHNTCPELIIYNSEST